MCFPPFGHIYMNSSNSSGLSLDIEILVASICNSPCAPGTCTAVLEWFCQLYTKNCWMTPELFFTPTYSTYDPTVNFPFNFLNLHSDALICNLLFLLIILTHSLTICYFCAHPSCRPHLTPHRASHIKELIQCDVLFGNPDIIPPNKLDCAPLLYLTPTQTNNTAGGRQCSTG